MKRHNFYTMHKIDGEHKAILHDGYTDGTYNYYKNGDIWYCIEPLTGYSVSYGYTRRAAQQMVESRKEMVSDFKATASYKTLCEVFTEARQAAKGLI